MKNFIAYYHFKQVTGPVRTESETQYFLKEM